MATAQQIQQKLNEAKANPNSNTAIELRRRLETGQYDTQLGELGLVRTPQGLKQSSGTEIKQDIQQTGQGIKEAVQKRLSNIDTIRQAKDSGEQSEVRSVLQTVGQVAGGVSDVIGETVIGAGKVALPQKAEEKVASTVQTGIEQGMERADPRTTLLSKYEELKQTNPKLARDIDSALGITSLALDIGTGGVAGQGAKRTAKAGQEAIEGVLKSADEVASASKKFTAPSSFKALTDVAEDVIPKAADLRDRTIAKALRLAPVEDISVIKQSTGNDIGEWMNRFELVKDTPAETMDALSKFKRENYDLVRDAISLVDEPFTFADVPQMEDSIDFLIKDLAGRKSQEYVQALKKLQQIKESGQFELLDAQYVKSVFDDVESLYKRTGEVRDAINAQDKAQTIEPVRRFIEDRVQEVYPDIDIRALNNNVQTSSAILDAAIKRAPKADTSSFFQLGDLAILGVGNVQTPGLGYGALFAKKLFESSPIQLRLSKYFAGKVSADDAVKGLNPDKIKQIKTLITKELKDSMNDPAISKKAEELKSAIEKAK